jgi:hypothetical protein
LRQASTVCIAVALALLPVKVEVNNTLTSTFPLGERHGLKLHEISILGSELILFVAKELFANTAVTARTLASVNS